MRGRAGFTLVEMVVALAVLGVMAGVAIVAFGGAEEPDAEALRAARVAAMRRQAVETRRPVPFTVEMEGGRVAEAHALPDGRGVGDSAAGVDALSGRPRVAAP